MAVAVIGEGIGNLAAGYSMALPVGVGSEVAGIAAAGAAGAAGAAAGIVVDPTLVTGPQPFRYPKK